MEDCLLEEGKLAVLDVDEGGDAGQKGEFGGSFEEGESDLNFAPKISTNASVFRIVIYPQP